MAVKYIGELFTKRVSSLLSDDLVFKYITLSFWGLIIIRFNYNRGLLVLVLDNLGYTYCHFYIGV